MTEMRGLAVDQWHAGLAEILSELGIGLVVAGSERVIVANETFCSLSGYALEELSAVRFASLFAADVGDVAIEQAAKQATYETEIVHRDGHRVPVEVSTRVVLEEEQVEVVATFRDLTSLKRMAAELSARARQQAVVAELGRQALVHRDLLSLIDNALAGVARTLDVELAAVFELMADDDALLLRAGVGWAKGVVGKTTMGTGLLSQAGYTLTSDVPVVVEDFSRETRFSVPPVLSEHGVVSSVSVILRGDAQPFGVLAAYTARPRSFTVDDVHFMRAVANVLAAAIARAAVETELATRARQQAVVAGLGRQALANPDLFSFLDGVVHSVAHILDVEYVEVLEMLPGGDVLLLRTGVGWEEGLVGHATVGVEPGSLVSYTLSLECPVVVEDLSRETRFTGPALLVRHGVVSGMSVVIMGAHHPWGVLGAHTQRRRRFSVDDANFLQATANVVAEAIGRVETEGELRAAHDLERRLRTRIETHSRRVVEAQEGERRHIARELHDEIGQALTGLKLTLERHERLKGEVDDRLERAKTLTVELLQRVHDLSLDLRPAMLDDLGLRPAILWLAERFGAQTGVEVAVRFVGFDGRLEPELETAAYRIVQEALTNVARHAGVDRAMVDCAVSEDLLIARVADEGIGFRIDAVPFGTSIGLAGMEERARSVGGRMYVQSEPGCGTRVVVELPLDNRPGAEL